MSSVKIGDRKFLGRPLDPRTMTYASADGSGGVLPEEMRQDVLAVAERDYYPFGNFMFIHGCILWWKKRLGIKA